MKLINILFLKHKFSIVHKAFFLKTEDYRESITRLRKDSPLLKAFLWTEPSLKNVASNLAIGSKEADFFFNTAIKQTQGSHCIKVEKFSWNSLQQLSK